MVTAKDLKELSSEFNILYAEDEEILRNSLVPTLQKFFKNVYVAKDGNEALELFKKNDIDIIFTDINMPIMNGIELISAINKLENNPMIIVLSAHDESKILQTLINLEVNSFINKPVDKEKLIHVLYKNCSIVSNKKLLTQYSQQLQGENEAMRRKNAILEQKLNQLAVARNKETPQKKQKKTDDSQGEQSYFLTLLQEDKDELADLSQELDTYIMMTFQHKSVNHDYIEKLAQVYFKYSAILNSYSEFYELSSYLHNFAEVIINMQEKFLQDIEKVGIYLESFQLTLETFRQNVWEKEAKDPKFYNVSLANDIKIIIDFLENKEIEENEIEFF